jgi:tetratricopeptide (TPR) repeat protein
VAQLGAQAALALEYAHQMGMVHRDIKPANLILDATGQLWVADFGLARCRTEPALTGTGDVVGTLRYMSPEQALAKRGLVDHRSDIYSLGATLYESVTLQPAYPGQDREELLQQIATGEPRPARRVNRRIPVALETILLKAMAREPDGRYGTAQEMADDLCRFVDGQPVQAVRPKWYERAARWAGRHRAALSAAVGMLLLSLVGLVAASLVFWRQREAIRVALVQAQEQKALAESQRRRTEADFEKALNGVLRMLMELDSWPGAPPPSGSQLRRTLIERGLQCFRDLIDEKSPDPTARFQSGLAYRLMASVYSSEQDVAQAQAMMRKAFALLEDLVDAHPQEPAYRSQLIATHYLMAMLHTSTGYPREARAEYARTAELYDIGLRYDARPEALNEFAWFLVDCPDVTLRDPQRAIQLAEQAVSQRPGSGAFWNTLGIAQYRAGQWSAAIADLEKSMQCGAGGSAYDWFFLAMAHWKRNEPTRARTWYDKAVAHMDRLGWLGEDLFRYGTEAAQLLGRPLPTRPASHHQK